MAPQEAFFKRVDATALKQRLDDDIRLAIVEDTPTGGFWILWGEPAIETEYGIMCFGDIELKADGSLLVTAMSDVRMQTLLNLLQEIAADCLGAPKITRDSLPVLHKPPRQPSHRRRRR